jgi:uncharacterized membrane protein YedE/YeeE
MKYFKFIMLGIFFGIVGTKAEFVSWFRIHEMFHFESFHMYGIIGSAVVVGVIIVAIIKKTKLKNTKGEEIAMNDKMMSVPRYLIGGTIFGLGWAITGACPGPIYILIGNGYLIFILVWVSAILGTFAYGLVRDKIPH